MPRFVEITLITGRTFHVDTEGVAANPAIKRFAQKAKSGDWIETVEGAWVNPDQIVSAMFGDLPSPPTSASPSPYAADEMPLASGTGARLLS